MLPSKKSSFGIRLSGEDLKTFLEKYLNQVFTMKFLVDSNAVGSFFGLLSSSPLSELNASNNNNVFSHTIHRDESLIMSPFDNNQLIGSMYVDYQHNGISRDESIVDIFQKGNNGMKNDESDDDVSPFSKRNF